MVLPCKIRFSTGIVSWAVLCALLSAVVAHEAEERRVLIIDSYHDDYPWSNGEIAGIVQTFQQRQPELQLCIEHLDAKRLQDMPHAQLKMDLLATKYANRPPELLIAVDNPALDFTVALRKRIFQDVPVVFCGINGYSEKMLAGQRGITGVAELLDPAGTLDAILRLTPNVREIVVIHDSTVTGLATRKELEAVIPQFSGPFKFRFLTDRTVEQLLRDVAELREGSAVLILSYAVDAGHRVLSHAESTMLLRKSCNVPIYAVHELRLGHGIVGGSLLDGRTHGTRAAELALRVLAKEDPSAIPVETRSTAHPMFDYNELSRFGIPTSLLPDDARIINMPSSFYATHRTVILFSMSIVTLLCVIIALLVRDNIRRKRAQAALKESERRFRHAVIYSPFPVMLHAEDGSILQLSHSWTEITGYRPEEIRTIGDWTERAYGERKTEVRKDIDQLYALDSRADEGEYTIRTASGATRVWSFSSAPLGRLPDGRRLVISMANDVTERKQAEEALNSSEDKLRQAEKMTAIGQLAGGIAHDFNNQLTGIMGYADMLANRLEDEKLKHFAEGIVVSARRAADLTQKLLAFGRKGKYLSVPVNVHQILGEVVAILGHTVDKRIRISQLLRAHNPTTIGDPTQLQNALLNIAVNARDAMPQGGELTFSTDFATLDEEYCSGSPYAVTPGQYLRISISDTGCGMTDEVKKHLFEPFFTTKKPGCGTGMGLASVYGTVRNHHGVITVESEAGRGTTVHILLPQANDPASSVNQNASPQPVRGTSRILLVDDEQAVRDMAAEMLRELGHSVVTCADGEEAVAYYRENWKELDLVILDMVMPQLGGRETFIAMRRINPRVRALLSSGYSLNGEAQGILDEGVLAFVAKPYRHAELSNAVSEALARK